MRVLSLGTDRSVFDAASAARARQERYAAELGHLDAIVFSRRGTLRGFAGEHFSATPTLSRSRLLYLFDAWRIAKSLPAPDAITAQDPFETGLAALFIAWQLSVPLHVQVHTDFTAPAYRRHSLLNRIRYSLAWFVLRRAARVRVILQRTKDELEAGDISAPITVLPIFVDTARFGGIAREKHPRWKIDALYVGRLEPEKHPCLALDAIAAARRAGHDIGLTVVGEGSEREILARKAREMKLEARVEFIGARRDIRPYLAKADVVLVPSRYEGYGLVIVEALAAGIPVIATDVGIAREAGAIVAADKDFPAALLEWIVNGPRSASLAAYPYADEGEYVHRWCEDVAATKEEVPAE